MYNRPQPAGGPTFPARAAMLSGVDGQLSCGKLLAGGLFAVETEGRHRYYRLAGFTYCAGA